MQVEEEKQAAKEDIQHKEVNKQMEEQCGIRLTIEESRNCVMSWR